MRSSKVLQLRLVVFFLHPMITSGAPFFGIYLWQTVKCPGVRLLTAIWNHCLQSFTSKMITSGDPFGMAFYYCFACPLSYSFCTPPPSLGAMQSHECRKCRDGLIHDEPGFPQRRRELPRPRAGDERRRREREKSGRRGGWGHEPAQGTFFQQEI